MQQTQQLTDAALSEYQYHLLAREAATAGHTLAGRTLSRNVLTTGAWGTVAWKDVAHDGGTYSVSVTPDACSNLSSDKRLAVQFALNLSAGDLIEVTSTGQYEAPFGADSLQGHSIVACYAKSKTSSGMPPALEFAFISQQTFDWNGGPDLLSYVLDGDGNVHSNDDMVLGPQVEIEGHATYVTDTGSKAHEKTDVYSFQQGDTVPLQAFDPEVFRPAEAHTYFTGSYDVSGTVTIGSDAHTEDNPFIWFIDGDLSVGNNAHLVLPGHTIIVTTGTFTVSGTANVTAVPDLPPDKGTEEEMRAWITRNLTEDGKNKIAFYSNGDAEVGGTGAMVGNVYTNGDFTLNGGGKGSNFVGAVTALGEITANGGGNGNNFWYTGAHDSVVIPGIMIPGQNIITLVAISEWTDSVVDYVP
ncbi:MAG: hypothetical protein ACOCTG_04250 [Bacteroidota bacterium]